MSATVGPTVPRRSPKNAAFSDHQIRQVANGNSISRWAEATARERGISVRRMPNDKFVKAVSRLSDGVVDLDPVEELLVALGRAGVITSFQRGLLQVHYLR
jgi:hypothetical protein